MASSLETPVNSASRRVWLLGGLWSWAQIGIGAVVAIFQARLAVTLLEPTQSGLWFILLSFMALVLLMDFGLSATLARELAFKDDAEYRSRLLVTSEKILRFAALGAFVLLAPLGILYLHSITPSALWSGTWVAWLVFVLGASLTLHSNAASGVLYGTGRLALDRQIRILTQVLGLGIAYFLLRLDPSLLSLCIAWLIQSAILWVLEWGAVRRWVPTLNSVFDKTLAWRLISLGMRWWVTSLGAYLILNTDSLVIAGTLGADRVPDYALLARMSAILQPMALVFVSSTAPLVSRLTTDGQHEQVRSILVKQVRTALLLVLLAGAILAAIPDTLLELWVGPGHFVGFGIINLFIVLLTLEVHHVAHAVLVTATGRLPFALWAIGSGALNIIFSLILVRYLGLLGVVLGSVLAQLFTNNWYAPLYSLKTFALSLKQYSYDVLLPMTAIGLVLYMLARRVRDLAHTWDGPVLVMTVTLLTTVTAGIGFMFINKFAKRQEVKNVH